MGQHHFILALTSSLLLTAACSSSVDESSQNGDPSVASNKPTPSPAPGGSDKSPPCSVQADNSKGGVVDPTYKPFACQLPIPCATVNANAVDPSSPSHQIDDLSAAQCILKNLRDRTPSQLTFHVSKDGGQSTSTQTIFIVDKDHAAANISRLEDVSWLGTTLYHELIQPPSYFDGCLALTDSDAILGCLEGWSAGCAENVTLTCPQSSSP